MLLLEGAAESLCLFVSRNPSMERAWKNSPQHFVVVREKLHSCGLGAQAARGCTWRRDWRMLHRAPPHHTAQGTTVSERNGHL